MSSKYPLAPLRGVGPHRGLGPRTGAKDWGLGLGPFALPPTYGLRGSGLGPLRPSGLGPLR